jgi:subtilase family serine protease
VRAFCRFSSRLGFAIILVALAATFPSSLLAQQSNTASSANVERPLITQPVDEAQVTVLKGNMHPFARPEFDLGTAPATLPMQRMLLVLKRSLEQEAALRKLLEDQQDKASLNYHKWLTPEQFGQQFGPTDGDMQTITSWLQSHGFQVGTTKGRTVLEFSGSASQVKEAFHTSIHKYVVKGEQHWANSSDPSIPAALTPAVAGVLTLHNFLKKPNVHLVEKNIPAKFTPGSRPQFTAANGLHALTPADYSIIYNAGPAQQSGVNGYGITIGIVGRSNLFNGGQDVSDFQNVFGLPANLTNILLNGPDPGDLGGDEEVEATLDTSWSAALATDATVALVVSATTNTTDGIDLSELFIIENNFFNIMTESFGSCEADVTTTDAQGISFLAEQAAAQGITYTVSTGDAGAAGCDDLTDTTAQGPVSVNVLASTPFTVAVGGTMFNENGQDATYWNTTNSSSLGSAKSYIPEDVWNETCTTACGAGQPPLAAGAGGASVYFPKPAWQSLALTGMPNDGARDIPDVSLSAAGHDPYLLCIEGSCVPNAQNEIGFEGVEGTSASAPSFAGIMALVEAKTGQVGTLTGGRQGLANYVLYALAEAQQANTTLNGLCNGSSVSTLPNSACVFNDVTVGNNSVPGEVGYPDGLYAAGTGFDLASGLGSVNIANLANAWSTVSSAFRTTNTTLELNSSTAPISVSHGASVSVAIAVVPVTGTGTPTGTASLTTGHGVSGPSVAIPIYTLNAGSLTTSTTQLPGGNYTVAAYYAGDGTFGPSYSNPVEVTVTQEGSTTAVSAVDRNSSSIPSGTMLPFGSFVFVRADVAGVSGQGVPTGMVTFADSCNGVACNLPGPIYNPVANPASLNSQGNTSIGAGVINFDAGTHSISASYAGDASFNSSKTAQPVTFTIQPGFAGISGPTNVTITSPGMSGTSTVSFIASSNFTTAVGFTCSGLPAEATCSSTPIAGSGPNTPVNVNITVPTTAPHLTMLQPNHRRYYLATFFSGGLPLAGILLLATPRRRRSAALLGLMVLALLVTLPACGGGSGSGGGGGGQQHQDPGTPAGTYTVTLTAAAGSLSEQATFSLIVQ